MGYSQSELAELLGCSTSFVNKCELRKRRMLGASAFALEDLTGSAPRHIWDEGPIKARDWVAVHTRAS
jgi:hypothetical protein